LTAVPGARPVGSLRILIRIHPGAGRSARPRRLADGSYRIDVKSPPVDGKANDELIRFISREFGAPRDSVSILTGASSRLKLLLVNGATRVPDWFHQGDAAGSPV
jgi:uncharacterized protein